jgi:hypothetical protein
MQTSGFNLPAIQSGLGIKLDIQEDRNGVSRYLMVSTCVLRGPEGNVPAALSFTTWISSFFRSLKSGGPPEQKKNLSQSSLKQSQW